MALLVFCAPNSMMLRERIGAELASARPRRRLAIACGMTVAGVLIVLFSDYREEFVYFRF